MGIQQSSQHIDLVRFCINTILFLQFSPSDPSKLMVCSVDSPVHIISEGDVICKFKGMPMVSSFGLMPTKNETESLTFFPCFSC